MATPGRPIKQGSTTIMTPRTPSSVALFAGGCMTLASLGFSTGVQAEGFIDDSTLSLNLRNFYINRNNGRIIFRSLSNAQAPFQFTSVFTETGSRTQTNVNFDWSNPRSLAIGGFGQPIAVSLN